MIKLIPMPENIKEFQGGWENHIAESQHIGTSLFLARLNGKPASAE